MFGCLHKLLNQAGLKFKPYLEKHWTHLVAWIYFRAPWGQTLWIIACPRQGQDQNLHFVLWHGLIAKVKSLPVIGWLQASLHNLGVAMLVVW
jgi:hypothetical protein